MQKHFFQVPIYVSPKVLLHYRFCVDMRVWRTWSWSGAAEWSCFYAAGPERGMGWAWRDPFSACWAIHSITDWNNRNILTSINITHFTLAFTNITLMVSPDYLLKKTSTSKRMYSGKHCHKNLNILQIIHLSESSGIAALMSGHAPFSSISKLHPSPHFHTKSFILFLWCAYYKQ